jgi:Protein of unknown function (DUF1501)
MFSICDPRSGHNRRGFLRIGTLGGLALARLLAGSANAAEARSLVTGKSLIFLHMYGGPTQFETFDPKMTAPVEIRSTTGETTTSLPGVTFGATFLKLARLAHKLAVVRSYHPGNYDHSASPIVNLESLGANLGSYYARLAGLNHPATGLPTNLLLSPRAILADAVPLFGSGPHQDFGVTGSLGRAYAPFMPGAGSDLQQNMQLKIAQDRLDDRRALLGRLDSLKRELDTSGAMDTMDRYRGQALDVVMRGVADAFDLSKEDPKTVARYDTAPLVRVESIPKTSSIFGKYCVDHACTVGKLLLLARRLTEAGCGFVTVNTNCVWDMHGGGVNTEGPAKSMPYIGLPFDHAVSALIEDLEARGLSDKVLLVCCGEMGRSPRVNKGGGRDHWGSLAPLLLHGGGLKMGQVIGRSTADGGQPAFEPVRIPNLFGTIMHTLFDVGEVRVTRGLGSDVTRVITEGEPVRELIG